MRLLYLDFKSFFSPLTGQPKKLTYYTIPAMPSWYNSSNHNEGRAEYGEKRRGTQ